MQIFFFCKQGDSFPGVINSQSYTMTACKTFKFQADTREGTDGRSLTVHIPEVNYI